MRDIMVINIFISVSGKDFHLHSVIWSSNQKWKSFENMAPIIDSSSPDNQKAIHTLTPRKKFTLISMYMKHYASTDIFFFKVFLKFI